MVVTSHELKDVKVTVARFIGSETRTNTTYCYLLKVKRNIETKQEKEIRIDLSLLIYPTLYNGLFKTNYSRLWCREVDKCKVSLPYSRSFIFNFLY